MPLVHYLAYGSNLHPLRFAKRVPSAQIIGRIELAGYQIAFHKKGKDGSGKCLFYKTGDKAHIMYGALYSFDSREKKELDRLLSDAQKSRFARGNSAPTAQPMGRSRSGCFRAARQTYSLCSVSSSPW